jgi:hypothetical protein
MLRRVIWEKFADVSEVIRRPDGEDSKYPRNLSELLATRLRGATSQNTTVFIFVAVGT